MATLSTVSVDFVANVAKFTEGLKKMASQSKVFSAGIKKDSKAAAADLQQIGKAAAAAGAAIYTGLAVGIGKSIADISKLKDEADKIGSSASGLMALANAAEMVGASIDDVKRSFVELQKSINEARNGNEKTIQYFDELRLSFVQLSALKPEERFKVLADALSKVTDENKRTEIGLALLGKAFTEIRPLIDGGTAAMQEAFVTNAKLGKSLAEVDIKNIKALGENFELLFSSIKGGFNILTAAIAPALNKIIGDMMEWLKTGDNMVKAVTTGLYALATPIYMLIKGFDVLVTGFKLGQAAILRFVAIAANSLGYILSPINDVVGMWDSLANSILASVNVAIEAINRLTGKAIPLVSYKANFKEQVTAIQTQIYSFAETTMKVSADLFTEAIDSFNNGYGAKFLDIVGSVEIGIRDAFARANITAQKGLTDLASTFNNAGNVFRAAKGGILDSIDKAKLVPMGYQIKLGSTPNPFNAVDKDSIGKDMAQEKRDEAYKKEYERIQRVGIALRESTKTSKEVYEQRVKDINAASYAVDEYGQILVTVEQTERALIEAQKDLQEATQAGWMQDIQNMFEQFASGFEDAILQAKSFSDVLKGLADDVMRVLIRQVLLRNLFNMGGAFLGTTSFGSSAGIGGNLGDSIFGGGKATGGPVNAGTIYTVGEEGPETFVPRTNGYIIPNGVGGGNTTTVVQNITVQAGVSQTVRTEMMSLLPQFKASAMAGVIDAKSRGGSYAKAIN